jgi:predicted O-methyltransferase YrrM
MTQRDPQTVWTDVDRLLEANLLAHDGPSLEHVLERSRRAGLPEIAVSPCQGQFLYILARLCRARRILEVGTLGGYSTLFLARGLEPGGKVITLEIDPKHAAVARENFVAAGLSDRIDMRVGPASESIRAMTRERDGPLDLVFIDADKQRGAEYFELALPMIRPGGVIVIDNIVRAGDVADATNTEPRVVGSRRAIDTVGRATGCTSTAIQTVGVKGYDGFSITIVNGNRADPT